MWEKAHFTRSALLAILYFDDLGLVTTLHFNNAPGYAHRCVAGSNDELHLARLSQRITTTYMRYFRKAVIPRVHGLVISRGCVAGALN